MTLTEIIIAVVGTVVSGLVTAVLKVRLNDDQRKQLDWAIEKSVAFISEKYKDRIVPGALKKEEAIKVAASLAPAAMKKLDSEQRSVVVDATYARMRAHLPTTAWVSHGDALDHQTESVVAPLPKPARVPPDAQLIPAPPKKGPP